MATKPSVTYKYRGQTERDPGRSFPNHHKTGYRWLGSYSEDSPEGYPLYPWMTRNECLDDAKARGLKAKFVRPE